MIITAVCALITRRLMFHGGAALGDHHDEELDEGWPKQRIGYPQGIAWFITGIGRLYLWIANIVSNIVKGLCIAIMETVRFVLVTIPSVTIQSLIWMLRFFHSSKSLMVEFYVFLVMFTALGFATHYPALLNVTTVFRIFTPIVIVVSSWQMYHLLDKIGKKHTEHS